jgi:hypothetical protein
MINRFGSRRLQPLPVGANLVFALGEYKIRPYGKISRQGLRLHLKPVWLMLQLNM